MNQRGKKLCPMGLSCRYLHEYQHVSEFYHQAMPKNNEARIKEIEKEKEKLKNLKGNILGGSSSSISLSESEIKRKREEYLQKNESKATKECIYCSRLIKLSEYSIHIKHHEDEFQNSSSFVSSTYPSSSYPSSTYPSSSFPSTNLSSSDSLKYQQDQAYNDSLIKDKEKFKEEEKKKLEKEKEEKEKLIIEENKKKIDEIINNYKNSYNIRYQICSKYINNDANINNNNYNKIRIKFTLPSSKKIIHTFIMSDPFYVSL